MASLSQWMPPARSTALRTSTGQAGFCTCVSGYLFFPSFSLIHVPVPASPVSHPCHALFSLTSVSSQHLRPFRWSFPFPPTSRLLWAPVLLPSSPGAQQPLWFSSSPGNLLHDAQCVVGPSCLSQVRRRLCELLLWIEVFTSAVTSVRSGGLGKGKRNPWSPGSLGVVEPKGSWPD